MGNQLAPPPPYDLTTPWWKKHNETCADCCMECVCRTLCLPCCLTTCLWGSATSIVCCPCHACQKCANDECDDSSTKHRKQKMKLEQKNKEQPREPCGGLGCWGPFQYFDTNLPCLSLCCNAFWKRSVRFSDDERKAWNQYLACISSCWQGFKDCVECIVCCPCNCCTWCWDSRCVRGIRECCENVGFYTGRCLIGCRDCVYYGCECCLVPCGLCPEPEPDPQNQNNNNNEDTRRASAPNAF